MAVMRSFSPRSSVVLQPCSSVGLQSPRTASVVLSSVGPPGMFQSGVPVGPPGTLGPPGPPGTFKEAHVVVAGPPGSLGPPGMFKDTKAPLVAAGPPGALGPPGTFGPGVTGPTAVRAGPPGVFGSVVVGSPRAESAAQILSLTESVDVVSGPPPGFAISARHRHSQSPSRGFRPAARTRMTTAHTVMTLPGIAQRLDDAEPMSVATHGRPQLPSSLSPKVLKLRSPAGSITSRSTAFTYAVESRSRTSTFLSASTDRSPTSRKGSLLSATSPRPAPIPKALLLRGRAVSQKIVAGAPGLSPLARSPTSTARCLGFSLPQPGFIRAQ